MNIILSLEDLVALPRKLKRRNKRIIVDLQSTKYEVIQEVI
jgi:hypothetical protein